MDNTDSRIPSIIAYVIPLLGPSAVLIAAGDDPLAQHHARQALGLNVAVIGLTALWAVVAWIVAWIPLAGPLISASLFALVILGYLVGVALWVIGLYHAVRANPVGLPIVSGLTRRLFPR